MARALSSRARVHYTGQVQGVGFRRRAADVARGFAVTGFVRNLPDGRVELVAEGERAEVERFLAELRTRFAGLIAREDASWPAASGEFREFGVRR